MFIYLERQWYGEGESMSISEAKNEILHVLNKYEQEPQSDDIAKYNGRFVKFLNVSAEELEKGLQEGKYRISYIGEFYEDYGRWGGMYYADIPNYNGWKSKCEEEGYFYLESICFSVDRKRVVGLFYDEWMRNDDHVLIFDYYIVEDVQDLDEEEGEDYDDDYEESEEEDEDYSDEEDWDEDYNDDNYDEEENEW